MAEEKTKKQPSRRSMTKYPALKRDLNLKVRRYYIEADYINGVYDEEGNQVIRSLTEDEKEWLNKFYEESVCTVFKKDGTDIYDSDEKRRELYRENNYRNRDLYNNRQKRAMLTRFEFEKYDKLWYDSVGHLDHELLLISEIEGGNDD